jgi:Domain of unknown function (DUF4157)
VAPIKKLILANGAQPLARLDGDRRTLDPARPRIPVTLPSSITSRSGQRSAVHRSLLRLQRQYGHRYVGQVLRQAGAVEGSGGDMDAIERSIDQARGGGRGMVHGTRTRMEAAFGTDFSGVRIHTDSRADGLSQSLSARAFTTGRDVFFRQGEYSPGTSSGRELLAHELTHVVQQNGDGIQGKMTVSEPGDAHEIEADQMAQVVMQQEHTPLIDRQVVPPQEEEQQPVAAKRETDFCNASLRRRRRRKKKKRSRRCCTKSWIRQRCCDRRISRRRSNRLDMQGMTSNPAEFLVD